MSKEVVIFNNSIYEKVDNTNIIVADKKEKECVNDNEAILDEIGRVKISIKIREKLGIEEKDLIEEFVDEEKIILKKLEIDKKIEQESTLMINKEYEAKLQISKMDYKTKSDYRPVVVDELGRIFIWREIRKQVNAVENDKFDVDVKDDTICLIKKPKN